MAELILSPSEARMLDRLRLNPLKSFPGRIRGERLTRKAGLSIEFADYREYAEGDDLRHLDWNVLARLDAPIMKSYRDEEDLAVHIVVDESASMGFGEPAKLQTALRLAACLAYTATAGGDAVYPFSISAGPRPGHALRGRAGYARFCGWAAGLQGGAKASLSGSLKALAASKARSGLCLVFSDGLDPDAGAAVRILAGRGHEVGFVHILSPLDIDPDIEGDLRLIDSETGATVEITANSLTMRAYKQKMEDHCRALEAEVVRQGGRYARVLTTTPAQAVVKDVFVRRGWLAA